MFHLPARVKRGNVSSPLNEIILIILWCKLWCNPFVWLSVFFSQLESLYVFVPHCFFVFFYDTSISDCSSLHQLNCNDSVLYEKAMECEDQGADSFANDNNHDCRWEETLATWQFWLKEGEFTPITTDKAINSRIIFHCSEEKTRNRKCLEESLTSNALCTSNVQLLDQTEKALHGTLSNERLFCNEVNLNTASLDDDIQSLVDCLPEFFDEAENCARPFRDNFKTTAAAERISDQTCRFVCMGRKGREGKML